MKYLGSKNRISKQIIPIMLQFKSNRTWVEPFVGGANIIDKIDGHRIGNDKNEYVICLLKALQSGWEPPKQVTETYYNEVKYNKDKYPKELVGYFGTQLTFGNIWFGTFRKDNRGNRRYDIEAYNNVLKQQPRLTGINFFWGDYKELSIPKHSIVYCDPPYKGCRTYIGENKINHDEFWEWCRVCSVNGNIVFVSEYNAPSDFKCIWEKDVIVSGNNIHKNKLINTERLFMLK